MLCEAEIIVMINEVFDALKLSDFTIKINNRKILQGFTEVIGVPGKEVELCVAIDKLDKVGKEKVIEELKLNGFGEESLRKLEPVFNIGVSLDESLTFLDKFFANCEIGLAGLRETKDILKYLEAYQLDNAHIELDITLARGLSYYTGSIFEVKANSVQIGSICGGGRYDNLTGLFGLKDISGVGISFGVDRIYDVLEELNLFPATSDSDLQVVIMNFGGDAVSPSIRLLQQLRAAGINAELFPEDAKMKKQMTYANKRSVPFVVVIGENELNSGEYVLKDMTNGEQQSLTPDALIRAVTQQV